MGRGNGLLVGLMAVACAFEPGGAVSEEGSASGGSTGPAASTTAAATTVASTTAASASAAGTSTTLSTTDPTAPTSGEATTTESPGTTTTTSDSTTTSPGTTTESTTVATETTRAQRTKSGSETTSGDPLDTIWCVDDCPAQCASIGPNLSCAGSFESFPNPGTQPSCPGSDLTYAASAGPGDWVINTAEGINNQWYGHGIEDHTTGSLDGRVFYGDLIDGTLDLAYYQETISVQPDTAYVIEFFAKDTVTAEPVHRSTIISVALNGDIAIADYTLPSLQGDPTTYERFTVGWFSGPSTELVLEVLNRQAQGGTGLDIAIDDLRVASCDFVR